MSKNITSSIWSASDVPAGLSFDTALGIFSGTPNIAPGQYVVPVCVNTNYGSDSKNVTILVEDKSYGVFSIGYKAAAWSNNATPDEYGLYPLDIPKAYKLRAHHAGFTAYSSGGILYDCGVDNLLSYVATPFAATVKVNAIPSILAGSTSYETILAYVTSKFSGSSSSNLQANFWVLLKNFDNNRLIADISGRAYANGSTSSVYVNSKLLNSSNIDNSNGILFPDCPKFMGGTKAFSDSGLFWLTNNGYSVGRLIFNQPKGSSTNIYYNVAFDDLDFRAIKIFDCNFCSFLSQELYLDNEPDKFPFGLIKDAWFMYNIGYVLTQDNNLYEFYDNTWTLLGNWPVKKLEILPFYTLTYIKTALFLSDNGELFHKGPALNGICDAHDTFTHILNNCSFHDFTLCYPQGGSINNATLTVLKE